MVSAKTRKIGKKYHIRLQKRANRLGFSITTRDDPAGGKCATYIKNIMPEGPAILDGRLKRGDCLLKVNGVEMAGKSQKEAVQLLKAISEASPVNILVSRQEQFPLPSPKVPASLQLQSGSLSIDYTPREVGLYKIEAFRDGQPVTKNPFSVEVCDPGKVKLTIVHEGVIGREQRFRVDCTQAGRGNISIMIRTGETEVHHSVREQTSGVFDVSFMPLVDRPHYLDVRYNGYRVPTCPQLVQIRDPKLTIIVCGQGLKCCVPKTVTSFLIETGGFAAAKDFDVSITDPVGSPLPVKCDQQKDGSLVAEFVPQHVGSHKIDVLYLDAHVSGSPFVSKAFDASKVILQRVRTSNYMITR